MITFTTDQTFQQDVLESTIPVVVDFMADWCQPCKRLAPILEEVADLVQGRVKIFKMNIDQNPETPTSLGIRSIPTLVLYKNGTAVSTHGGMTKIEMLDWLRDI